MLQVFAAIDARLAGKSLRRAPVEEQGFFWRLDLARIEQVAEQPALRRRGLRCADRHTHDRPPARALHAHSGRVQRLLPVAVERKQVDWLRGGGRGLRLPRREGIRYGLARRVEDPQVAQVAPRDASVGRSRQREPVVRGGSIDDQRRRVRVIGRTFLRRRDAGGERKHRHKALHDGLTSSFGGTGDR